MDAVKQMKADPGTPVTCPFYDSGTPRRRIVVNTAWRTLVDDVPLIAVLHSEQGGGLNVYNMGQQIVSEVPGLNKAALLPHCLLGKLK